MFIGIEPISCDDEKWPFLTQEQHRLYVEQKFSSYLITSWIILVWSKEVINFDFVLNKREKSGNGYIIEQEMWRHRVTHSISPIPLCSAVLPKQTLALGLNPEILRWLARYIIDNL